MQALVTLGLCDARSDGRFALAPLGEALRDDHPESLRAWAMQIGGVQTQRWGELAEAVRTGRGWRSRHEGQDGFDALANQPAAAAAFHRAMNELTRRVAVEVLEVVDLCTARRIVDVGGGSGELLAAVLAAHSAVHGRAFRSSRMPSCMVRHGCCAPASRRAASSSAAASSTRCPRAPTST